MGRMTADEERVPPAFIPRKYQVELAERCRHSNLVIALGTGAGKTYIAAMVANQKKAEVVGSLQHGYKRIIFLAPTRVLAHQQAAYLNIHTEYSVAKYTGEDNVDFWQKQKWEKEFEKNHLLLMTYQVFADVLSHKFFSLTQVSLLIMDECHSAVKDSPLMQILKFRDQCQTNSQPRILGLTASLINKNVDVRNFDKEVQELEKNIGGKAVTATDIEEVRAHATKARIMKEFFDSNTQDDLVVCWETTLSAIIDDLKGFDVPCDGSENRNPAKDSIKILRDSIAILNSIGILGLHYHIQSSFLVIAKLRQAAFIAQEEMCLDKLLDYFIRLGTSLEELLNQSTPLERIEEYTTPKVKKLLGILRGYKNELPKNFRGLVFVEQKVVCRVLHCILDEASQHDPELSFVKSLYIIGGDMSARHMSRELEVDKFKQSNIMKRFRTGVCNVLVSTSVLEEGVDVRECSLVIRFDLPKNFRGFVQSKGRARADKAKYILMVGPDDEKFEKNLRTYCQIENSLTENYRLALVDVDDVDDSIPTDDEEYAPFGVNGPRINSAMAVQNIYRYCDKLPSDRFTQLSPVFTIETYNEESGSSFRCTLTMPLNATEAAKKPVTSEWKPSKTSARRNCSLKMIKILHEAKELDDAHLLPVNSSSYVSVVDDRSDITIQFEEDMDDEPQKKQNEYQKKLPVELVNPAVPGITSYLHVLRIEGDSLEMKGAHRIGLLLPTKLPPLCRFPLYGREGEVLVAIEEGVAVVVDNFLPIFHFHKLICDDVLHAGRREELNFDPLKAKTNAFIVPVEPDETRLASRILDDCVRKRDWRGNCSSYYEEKKRNDFLFRSEDYFDAVVCKWYDPANTDRFCYVREILQNETPSSNFHGIPNRTFNDYYRQEYKVTIMKQDQPLILVEHVHSGLNFLKPKDLSKAEKKQAERSLWLVPELCLIHPLRSSIWRQAVFIPSIMWRLEGLLNAEFLRRGICINSGLGKLHNPRWPDLNPAHTDRLYDVDTSDDSDEFFDPYDSDVSEPDPCRSPLRDRQPSKVHEEYIDLADQLVKMDLHLGTVSSDDINKYNQTVDTLLKASREVQSRFPEPPPAPEGIKIWKRNDPDGPSPGVILQGLTSLKANDDFNLERFELVGDSFLKYSVSTHLYFKYRNMDEGRLTQCRSARICNDFLFQIGKQMGIPALIVNEELKPKQNWIPPCYTCDDSSPYEIETANKRIADVMEALIGCYLVTMGEIPTKRFLHFLGLQVLPLQPHEVRDLLVPPLNLSIDPTLRARRLNEELALCGTLETKLGYQFKNKAYLLQALTHPSYQQQNFIVTECYQRLEFLGDAVIDFLVTCAIYNNNREFGPGQLTDLRSALVNNTTLACIAVRNDFHKHLKRSSAALASSIEAFVGAQEKAGHEVMFYRFQINEEETMEVEEIEVPKCLGDLIEALCGAVFLDSNLSLDAVWNVVYRLLHKEIAEFSEHIPISPIRELYERFPHRGMVKFSQATTMEDGRVVISLTVKRDESEWTHRGCGRSKKLARVAAAKIAVRKDRERV